MTVDDLIRDGYRVSAPDEVVAVVQHGDRVVIVTRYYIYLAEDAFDWDGKLKIHCLAAVPGGPT